MLYLDPEDSAVVREERATHRPYGLWRVLGDWALFGAVASAVALRQAGRALRDWHFSVMLASWAAVFLGVY